MKIKNAISKLCTKIQQSADSYIKESEEHIQETKDIHSFGKLMAYDRMDICQEIFMSAVSNLRTMRGKEEDAETNALEDFFIAIAMAKEVDKACLIYFDNIDNNQ